MPLDLKGSRLNVAIVVVGLVYVASQATLAAIYHPIGPENCFRFWLAMDREVALSVLHGWGPEGIAQFKKHYRLDFIHPLLYGAALWLLMLRFCTALPGARAMRMLPWITAGCDIIENLFQLRVLAAGDAVSQTMVMLSGGFARTKWALAGVCVLIVLVGIVQTLVRALTSRTARNA